MRVGFIPPGRTLATAVLIAGACLGVGGAAWGQDSPSAPSAPPWYQEITVNGFLSTTYSYNFNHPVSGTNQFRVFDFDDNTFKVDVFELAIQKAVSKSGDAGFRVDAEAGQTIPRVTAAAGLFRDDNGKAADFDLKQAFVAYIAPLGRGLRLDLGKFSTFHGYEVIEGYDGYNDNVTRSFLFGYAEPASHVGVRAIYPFSGQVSAMVMVVNGWDNAKDNNSAKSVGAQLALTPSGQLSVYLNGMVGPERTNNNHDERSLLDLVAVWKPTARLTVGLSVDDGSEAGAVVEGRTARWRGAAGYLVCGMTDTFSLALRAERFDDRDGARTGVPQRLEELTLTPAYHATQHLVMRGDLRADRSNKSVFETQDGVTDHQVTVGFNVVYLF